MPTTGTMRYLTIGDSTYEVYNTDTEVIQTYVSASGYTNWRPLVVGYSSNSSETTAPTTITGTTYTFNTIKVKPSDGIIRFGAAALYNGDYTTTISADTLTAARTLTAPDKSGTIALTSDIPTVPSSTGSGTTGISIADHSTTTIYGVSSSTTSVTGVSGSTSVYGVKSGTNSTTTASKASGGNGTASSWTFEEKSIPNVTAAGSGSASLTFTMDTTDTKKLKIAFSHTHTAPTLGTAITVQSKSGGSNGTASTWSFSDVTVPIRADSATTVPTAASSATTVPIKDTTATTVITSKTHSVTDNGHNHTI